MTVVLQSVLDWLPLTQSWLATQLGSLPTGVRWRVVCESRSNHVRFWPGHLRARSRLGWADEDEVGWNQRLDRRTRFVARRLDATGATVVHSHFGNVGWRDLHAIRAVGRPVGHVVSFYGHDLLRLPQQQPRWRTRYQELFAEGGPRFLVEGPHMAKTLVAQGAPAKSVSVHHLGIDCRRIAYAPRPLGPGEPIRLLMAGRFVEKKGFPDGLRAVAKVARSIDLRVTLVGDADGRDQTGAQKAAILQAIAEGELGTNVRLAGFLSPRRLAAEARRHHLLLAPSRQAADGDTEGGCPMTVPELGASGLTVVSTRHADLPMLVRDGETGFSAAEGDIDGLAEALRRAVDARRRGHAEPRRFRDLVEADFDARKQGAALASIYEEAAP